MLAAATATRRRHRARPPCGRRCRRRPMRSRGSRPPRSPRATVLRHSPSSRRLRSIDWQQDLSRAERFDVTRDLDRIPAGRDRSRLRADTAPSRTSMETTTHCEPNRSAASRTISGRASAAVPMTTLSAPTASSARDIVDAADAAADRERHEALVGELVDELEIGAAALRRRAHVEEHEFVDVAQVVDLHRLHGAADRAPANRSERPSPDRSPCAKAWGSRGSSASRHASYRQEVGQQAQAPLLTLLGMELHAVPSPRCTADVNPPQYGVVASTSAGSVHATWKECTK